VTTGYPTGLAPISAPIGPPFDVVHILRKGRQQVTDCVADLSAKRADIDPKRAEQAVHLSAEKYCSASIMLGKTAEITHDFEVVEG
jgi:putative redox protein